MIFGIYGIRRHSGQGLVELPEPQAWDFDVYVYRLIGTLRGARIAYKKLQVTG